MSVRSGEAVKVVFVLDAEPDAALYVVEDEAGQRLLSETSVPGAAIDGLQITLDINGALNTLLSGVYRGLRMVRLRYHAEDSFTGWRELESAYDVIGVAGELIIQVNTFVAYNEALLLVREISDAAGFEAAERAARVAVLAEVWRILVKLTYTIPNDYARKMSRVTDFSGSQPGDLSDMTAAEFLTLEPRFIAALKRAQVVEAVERLGGRSINAARAQGLLSSTIGEVSQMYRSGRSVDIGVSPRALKELRGYVTFAPRIGRA